MQGRRWLRCVALLLALMQAGCWDRREVEEKSLVLATGIDLCAPNQACEFISTRQIAVPGRIPTGGSDQGGQPSGCVEVISVAAQSGPESQQPAEAQLNRPLSFGHIRLLVFGEEFARRGMAEMMDYSRRVPEARRLLWITVAEGRAEAVMRAKPELEAVPALYLNDMIEDAVRTGRLPRMYLGEFLIQLSNRGEDPVAPLFRLESPNEPELAGLAVFRENRMVGKLTPEETTAYMQLRGVPKAAELLPVPMGEGRVADVAIFSHETKYKVQWAGGRIHVHIDLRLEGNLQQISPGLRSQDPKVIDQIEGRAAELVRERAEALVTRLQTEMRADPLAVGERVRAFLPHAWKAIPDWHEAFCAASFEFVTQVNLRRFGGAVEE